MTGILTLAALFGAILSALAWWAERRLRTKADRHVVELKEELSDFTSATRIELARLRAGAVLQRGARGRFEKVCQHNEERHWRETHR